MNGAPIERFIEGVTSDASPAELLGLVEGEPTPERIRASLRERLGRVDAHPQGRSAEADEVRLALHVAAAQLADALPERGIDQPGDIQRPMQPIVPGERVDPRRRTLLAVVAHSGGWNATSKHRVGAIAHAMGLTLDEAIGMLSHAQGVSAGGAAPITRRATDVHPSGPALGATRVGRLLLAATALCALASLVLAGTIIWVVSQSGSHETISDGQSTGATSAPAGVPVPAPVAVSPTPVRAPVDTEALVRAFGRADVDAGAFETAYLSASTGWIELEPGALASLAYGAAEALANAGSSVPAFLAPITAGFENTDEPEAAVFAAAVLSRAEVFGALADTQAGRRAESLLGRLPSVRLEEPDPVASGSAGRLIVLARDPALDVNQWESAARAFVLQSPEAARVMCTRVIDAVLRGDAALDEQGAPLLRIAVAIRVWNRSDEELLRAWWENQAISIEPLALLSEELAASGVLGLDRSIVLDGASTPADRRASAGALSRALGGDVVDAAQDGFNNGWRIAFTEVSSGDASQLPDDLLAQRSARFAMLSASAALRWEGDTGGAETLLADAFVSDAEPAPKTGGRVVDPVRLTSPTSTPDGVWAARYLSARKSEDDRLTLLGELRAVDAILGPADADVLARAALIGASRGVRQAAQGVVRSFADDPFVLNGVLESLHGAVAQPDVDDLLAYLSGERLPSTDSRAWRGEARRAIAERLAEVVLGVASTGMADAERSVQRAYRARLRGDTRSSAGTTTDPNDPLTRTLADMGTSSRERTNSLAETCGSLWDVWYLKASRVPEGGWAPRSLVSIERRHIARGGYGTGSLQRFTLAQLGLVEVMGYHIASERPDRSDEIERVLRDTDTRWRDAGRVMEQVEICEGAMARLWAIRMGIELEGGT